MELLVEIRLFGYFRFIFTLGTSYLCFGEFDIYVMKSKVQNHDTNIIIYDDFACLIYIKIDFCFSKFPKIVRQKFLASYHMTLQEGPEFFLLVLEYFTLVSFIHKRKLILKTFYK